jgi:hypothetical protein
MLVNKKLIGEESGDFFHNERIGKRDSLRMR